MERLGNCRKTGGRVALIWRIGNFLLILQRFSALGDSERGEDAERQSNNHK